MTCSSLCSRFSTTLTNAYYVYSSSCDLVEMSPRVHRLFSIIDVINCLDFFPAAGRLKTAWERFIGEEAVGAKLRPLCQVISESTGMFSDVYWVVDELKKWNIVSLHTFKWAKPVYTIVSPLQYVWLLDSIHNSWRICKLGYGFTKQFQAHNASRYEQTKQYVLDHFSELQDRFFLPNDVRERLVSNSLEKTINELSCTICSTWVFSSLTTLTNVCYYSLSAIQYITPQSSAVSVLLLACSVSALALGIFYP